MSDLSVVSRLKAELHDNRWGGSMRALLSDAIVELEQQAIQVERKDKALRNVQKLISEAAMTGFNHKDGDWPERLFESQQVTSAALKAAISSDDSRG